MRLCFYLFLIVFFNSCFNNQTSIEDINQWTRNPSNPIFTDVYESELYQSASDAHVFFDNDDLWMIYSGDVNDKSSIKLAKGKSYTEWEKTSNLLFEIGPSGKDVHKETSFYRKSDLGKHQI